MNLLSN